MLTASHRAVASRRSWPPLGRAVWTQRVFGWMVVSWTLALSIAVASLIIAVLMAVNGTPVGLDWTPAFFTAASMLVATLPLLTLPALRAEGRVLRARRVPAAVWRDRVRGHTLLVSISVLVAALALVLLRMLSVPAPVDLLQALLPGALLMAVAGALLLLAAAADRLLPPLAGAALCVALVVAMHQGSALGALAWGAVGPHNQASGSQAWQAVLLGLAGTVLLPLSLAAVQRRLLMTAQAMPLAARASQTTLSWPGQLAAVLRRPFERLRLLDGAANGWVWAVLLSQVPNNLAMGLRNPDVSFLQPWDSSVTPLHALRLLLLTALALAVLRSDAMHWRCLLAPVGRFRRQLGPRIVAGSVLFLLLTLSLVLLAAGLAFTLLPFMPAVPWARLPSLALAYLPPLMADLLLATALATWLRGAAGSLGRTWAALAAVVLALALVFVGAAVLPFSTPVHDKLLWVRSWGHLAGELALAAVLTLAAQRVWQRADLAQLARGSGGESRRD